ncbi:Hypothetical_protein [Hexamita inflata]|uniref:Hypothetical_protein n=1 Tax=Hexamita inflata TaxID=28002 RepID=A0AA86Q0E1_9EUKA|nr:Hypothetical protein HINF_LOCUS37400 [Hexamita inflata]
MGFIDAFIHCWHYFCQVRSGNTDKLNIISFQQNQQHKINLSTQLIFDRILTKTVVQLNTDIASETVVFVSSNVNSKFDDDAAKAFQQFDKHYIFKLRFWLKTNCYVDPVIQNVPKHILGIYFQLSGSMRGHDNWIVYQKTDRLKVQANIEEAN